jgi:branched-chain amino acid transport system permease protein
MFEQVLQYSINGILIGGIYGLIGLGLVLINKSTGVFNFATGQLFLVGAFFCWTFLTLKFPVWASILFTLALMFILGFIIERFVLRPLLGQPVLSSIMATIGLMALLGAIVVFIWGPAITVFPTEVLPQTMVSFAGIKIAIDLMIAFIVVLAAYGFFAVFFRWNKVGLAMRATAEDQQLSRGTGINVKWIFSLTWGIACVMATLAGIFLAARLGLAATETPLIALAAFPVVILGGLDSIDGAILGGIIIGLVESLVGGLISPVLATITPYLILLIVLVIKPQGLFGMKRIERV